MVKASVMGDGFEWSLNLQIGVEMEGADGEAERGCKDLSSRQGSWPTQLRSQSPATPALSFATFEPPASSVP